MLELRSPWQPAATSRARGPRPRISSPWSPAIGCRKPSTRVCRLRLRSTGSSTRRSCDLVRRGPACLCDRPALRQLCGQSHPAAGPSGMLFVAMHLPSLPEVTPTDVHHWPPQLGATVCAKEHTPTDHQCFNSNAPGPYPPSPSPAVSAAAGASRPCLGRASVGMAAQTLGAQTLPRCLKAKVPGTSCFC